MSTTEERASIALRIYLVLSAAYVASQFYRVANAAIASELMAELKLSAEAMGAITGVFFLAFAAAQIPAGVLLDRYGPRRTMSGLFCLAVLGALAFALAQTAWTLGLARALIGVGCATGLMGAMVAIARWYPAERFAALTSLLFVIGGAGTLLATSPLAWAAAEIGWRGAFLAMAGLTGLFALLLYLAVRDAPAGAVPESGREGWRQVLDGLWTVMRNPELWKISALQFVAYACVVTVIGLWAGPYLTDVHGLDAVARGHALFVLNVAALLGVAAYGWIDRRVASRKWLLVGGALATAATASVLALWTRAGFGTAMALLVIFTVLGNYVMLNHAHARAILPDRLMGRGLTLQNLAVFLGVAALQSASGLIVGGFAPAGAAAPEAAYRTVFGFLALCLVAAAAVFATAKEPARAVAT
jgi:sugar phosphate permease